MAGNLVIQASSASGIFSGGGFTGTTLGIAAAGLSNGQSVSFTAIGNSGTFNDANLSWETIGHFDEVRGLVHVCGKSALIDASWTHEYYTLTTNAWTLISSGQFNSLGHIYGNFAYDPITGDLFLTKSMTEGDTPARASWYKQSLGNWSSVAPVNQTIFSGAMERHSNGTAFHPNLFGSNDGGLVVDQQQRIYTWRKSTDARGTIDHPGGDTQLGNKEGAAIYWPALDAVFIGGSAEGAQRLGKVTANPTPGGQPVLTVMNQPPIRAHGASADDDGGFGALIVHPGNASKMLLMETAALSGTSNGRRVWSTTDGNNWTAHGDNYHPFTTEPRVIVSIIGLGVVWSLSASSSVLWKPAP